MHNLKIQVCCLSLIYCLDTCKVYILIKETPLTACSNIFQSNKYYTYVDLHIKSGNKNLRSVIISQYVRSSQMTDWQ
jgi:hypothetical protein